MQRLKAALEHLDEMISSLEDRVGQDASTKQEVQKKHSEQLKQSRMRETSVIAVAQKIAGRLDHTIQHVERVLRD